MLEQIKKLQQSLCAVLLDKPREVRSLLPDGDEWNIIEEVLEVLKPFHRATTTMSASSYPTVSMLSPLLYKLKFLVLKVSEEDSQTTNKQFYWTYNVAILKISKHCWIYQHS